MCELSFADLGELNQSFFVNQSIINALANNHDGIGYIQNGEFWKSKLSGARITNLGSLAKDSITNDPLAFHTRYATNKKLNEDCHSHPFAGDKLILMHNGKLEKKDFSMIPLDKVDSQVFTEELEAEIEKAPDIPMIDLMPLVMERWCGKFAFMIFDKRDSSYYVIRGTTADLHWNTIDGRLVVNTQKLDLDKGAHLLRQMSQLVYGKDLKIGKTTALDVNTIYKFDPKKGELNDVGKLVENKPALASTTSWVRDSNYAQYPQSNILGSTASQLTDTEPIFKKMRRWLDMHGVSLVELNTISNVIMGCSLLELTTDDIMVLYAEVLRTLTTHAQTDTLKFWRDIVKQGYADWAYSKPDFSFPWMLNAHVAVAVMADKVTVEVLKRKEEKEKEATKE